MGMGENLLLPYFEESTSITQGIKQSINGDMV